MNAGTEDFGAGQSTVSMIYQPFHYGAPYPWHSLPKSTWPTSVLGPVLGSVLAPGIGPGVGPGVGARPVLAGAVSAEKRKSAI